MEIKSKTGKLLGNVTENSTTKEAKSSTGKYLGKYTKHDNITWGPTGARLASGDILSSLIWQNSGEKI